MKYGLYGANGLIDTCHESSKRKASATFREWYGLNSLRGYHIYEMNENDGWYVDNYDGIQQASSYRQRMVK
jgi:hypothetical protein